jgi:hypothetical protein
MSQAAVEKANCTKCQTFATGRYVNGGFACEECIMIFTIQNQLWGRPAVDREKIVIEEVLSRAV